MVKKLLKSGLVLALSATVNPNTIYAGADYAAPGSKHGGICF